MLVECSDWSHQNSTLQGRDGVLEAVRLSHPESPWDSQLCAEESLWSPSKAKQCNGTGIACSATFETVFVPVLTHLRALLECTRKQWWLRQNSTESNMNYDRENLLKVTLV